MSSFTTEEIARLDRTDELRIAGRRADDSLRKAVIIWMVTFEGELYVRSVNGPDAAWFRGTQVQSRGHISAGGIEKDVTFTRVDDLDEALDAAYAAKYRSYPSAVASINSTLARATTLRVDAA
jgi:hypothetical protein